MGPSDTTTSSSTNTTTSSTSDRHVIARTTIEEDESLAVSLLKSIVISATTYICVKFLVKNLFQTLDPTADDRKPDKSTLQRLNKIIHKRNQTSSSSSSNSTPNARTKLTTLELNKYEASLASDVIDPDDLNIHFRDIGGIDSIKAELWDLVVLPLLRPDLFQSKSGLVSPPRGILLYGAPGTGKTMLAKAIAKEGKAAFVNVRLSTIMDKWFGESNKLIAATFGLATKLAPSVIFIDELDTFLNQRDGSDGCSAASTMKSEFLTLWDGMVTNTDRHVTVLAATNRPYDVDSAILRRLPRTFEIDLPSKKARVDILKIVLEQQEMTVEAKKGIVQLAEWTEGYSGSDLKELCRAAAMEPVREMTRGCSQRAVSGKKVDVLSEKQIKVRPVNWNDFKKALRKVKRSGETAKAYLRKESSGVEDSSTDGINVLDVVKGMKMMQHMMTGMGGGRWNHNERKKDEPSHVRANQGDDLPNLDLTPDHSTMTEIDDVDDAMNEQI